MEELKKRQAKELPELVFTTLKGNKLNVVNIREMIYNYSEKAGINKNLVLIR